MFHDGLRVDTIQFWEHHGDGTITFHIVFTLERDGKVLQREVFQELYHPIKRRVLIQSGACDLIPQLRQLQRQIPAADGTIQHRFNARTGKDGLIMLPEDIPPALVEAG